MFQKLISIEEISTLEPGTVIIKYPLKGRPTEEIDLSKSSNFHVYEVNKLVDESIVLDDQHNTQFFIRAKKNKFVSKTFMEIVKEGVWWARPQEK